MDIKLPLEGPRRFLDAEVGPTEEQRAEGQAEDRRDEEDPDGDREAPMPAPPAGQPDRDRIAMDRDRLVGQPVLDVAGQGAGRFVPVLGLPGQCLQADCRERLGDPWQSCRGGVISPARTLVRIVERSGPSQGGTPVRRKYRVAPRP